MAQGSTKESDELLAGTLLRKELGVAVTPHDDNSRQSMYDLTLTYPDGRQAAAEVVSTRDKLAMKQAIAAGQRGYTRDSRLTRTWRVMVDEQAILKRVASNVVPLLQQLEQAGLKNVRHGWGGGYGTDMETLRVDSCWSFEPTHKHPPGFYLFPTTKGAWVGDADDVTRESDKFLPTVPDVASKLAASGLSERHALVVVTVDWFQLFASLESGALPAQAPTLPQSIECLWLLTMKSPPIRALYWLGDGSWRSAVLTEGDLGIAAVLAD